MGEGGKDRKTEDLELPCYLEIRNFYLILIYLEIRSQRAEGTSGFSKEYTGN